MKQKICIGLIYGGKSVEHEVSEITAESIRKNIDREKFEVIEIYVNKEGKFDRNLLAQINVAFLAWHGPNCEDGKFQKFLEKKKIKYIGSDAKASRINLDKDLQKRYFQKAGLKTVNFFAVSSKIPSKIITKKIIKNFGYPCFIKPSNTGSTLGINRCKNEKELNSALKEARKISPKIVIEKAVEKPREIEVAVLGNKKLIISEPGEILTKGRVYSYESKYFKPFKTQTVAKNLSLKTIKEIKKMAKISYRATGCCGYARIDFFLAKDEEIYINEINTLPGFTKISMFPKMMEACGIKYRDLITKIINLALR